MSIRRSLQLAAILAGSCVLLWSVVGKVSNPYAFAEIVRSHDLLPVTMSDHAAWAVIVIEILVPIAALWIAFAHEKLRQPLWMLAAVFGVFAVYCMLLVYAPPPEPTSCGCAGATADAEHADWRFLTIRNSGTAAMLGLLGSLSPRQAAADASPARMTEVPA